MGVSLLSRQHSLSTRLRSTAWIGAAVLVALVFSTLVVISMTAPDPAKMGAGFFISYGDEVLLLRRHSKHHNKMWAFTGGNAEKDDKDLLDTAHREATEEMGEMPEYTMLGEVLTIRGRKLQKYFTVYIVAVSKDVRENFVPRLSDENNRWRWFKLEDLKEREDLHPIANIIVKQKYNEVLALLK